jgi:hypothetical protein
MKLINLTIPFQLFITSIFFINYSVSQTINNDKGTTMADNYLREKRKFVVGSEGNYGVTWVPKRGSTIPEEYVEGLITNGMIYEKNSAKGPVIKHTKDNNIPTRIEGLYSRTVFYETGTNERVYIEIVDNSKKRLKNIEYRKNSKSTWFYKNGESADQTRETGIFDLKKIIEEEVDLARKSIKGFNTDSLNKALLIIDKLPLIINDFEKNELKRNIVKWSNQKTTSKDDCNKLMSDYSLAMKYKMTTDATMLINKNFDCTSNYGLAYHYREIKNYGKAIEFLKKWEIQIKSDELTDLRSCYSMLSECYTNLKDTKNASLYKTKYSEVEKKLHPVENNTDGISSSDWRIYCYSTYEGQYKLKLDDVSKNVKYELYKNGVAVKTLTGTWKLKDEGIYGTAYMLTISWTGANSNLPETKYVAQYDGYGNLQGLIDNQNRTWDKCK